MFNLWGAVHLARWFLGQTHRVLQTLSRFLEAVYELRNSGHPALKCPKNCVWIQFQRRFFGSSRLGNPGAIKIVNRFLALFRRLAGQDGGEGKARKEVFCPRLHLVLHLDKHIGALL